MADMEALALDQDAQVASGVQTASSEAVSHTMGRVVPLVLVLAALTAVTVLLVNRHDYARSTDGE